MKMNFSVSIFLILLIIGTSCEVKPGFHEYTDLGKYLKNSDTIRFVFNSKDSAALNDLWLGIRYSSDYDWSRFFAGYEIRDSIGHRLDSGLLQIMLFDPVSGVPAGKSGIGDLYELEQPLKRNFRFTENGEYRFSFWQMMRQDSVRGIKSLGLRVVPAGDKSQ
jgi:gliding motility-associated lipoprotein GldH